MPKIPRLTASKFIKILNRLDFYETRQEGSHKIFKNDGGVRVTVPFHRGRTIHPKIIKTFLTDIKMTLDDFISQL